MEDSKTNIFPNIYLFSTKNMDVITNPLKEYLFFIRSQGHQGVVDFAFSQEKNTLHQQLTIKENFILDSIPLSLIKDNENNLFEFLESQKNPFIIKLLEIVGDLNLKVKDLSKENIKIVSLLKSLLSNSEFVFLVNPTQGIKTEYVKLLKQSISHEAQTYGRKFFISPVEEHAWVDITTHYVTKCSKTKQYHLIENNLNSQDQQINLTNNYKFTLIKQAS